MVQVEQSVRCACVLYVCIVSCTITFLLIKMTLTSDLDNWHTGSSRHYLGQNVDYRSKFAVI